MARNYVTRTITGTKVTAKVVDLTNDTIGTREITLAKKFDAEDTDKIKQAVRKALADDTTVEVVAIVNAVEVNKLYGVKTDVFMANAIELDMETRKPLATTDKVAEVEE